MGEVIERLRLKPKDTISVGSVRTFLDVLEAQQQEEDKVFFFRGHSNFSYKLKPSIYRNKGLIENEDILFKELILRCPNDFDGQESTFQTLVKMQHYFLPTRLLDLTTNPLMALWFACSDQKNKQEHGEVVMFQVPKREIKYFDSDTVSVIANISRRPKSFILRVSTNNVKDFNKTEEIRYLLHEIKKEKPYFESVIQRKDIESVVFVKSKLDNPRIIRQDGAFLLFGIQGTKLQCAEVPNNYLFLPEPEKKRICVLSYKKTYILEQLKVLGITGGSIFPEIDRVASYLKDIYTVDEK